MMLEYLPYFWIAIVSSVATTAILMLGFRAYLNRKLNLSKSILSKIKELESMTTGSEAERLADIARQEKLLGVKIAAEAAKLVQP